MAAPSFLDPLRSHLSRIRVTTFRQLTDHLISTRYTPERYPRRTSGDRRDEAKRELAETIRIGKAEGWLVEETGVLALGENPGARLCFDSARDGEPTPDQHAAIVQCWEQMRLEEIRRFAQSGRERIAVIYTPRQTPLCNRRFSYGSPASLTAELVATSVYFGLPPELQSTWNSWTEDHGYAPTINSILADGSSAVACLVVANYRPAGIFVPVLSDEIRPERLAEHEAEFVAFFRWVMATRLEVTDDPLQIWSPEPKSVQR